LLNRIEIRSDVFGKHQFDLRVVGRGRAVYRLAHEGGGGILRPQEADQDLRIADGEEQWCFAEKANVEFLCAETNYAAIYITRCLIVPMVRPTISGLGIY